MRLLVSGATATMRRLAAPDSLCRSHLGVLATPATRNSPDSLLSLDLPWACDNAAFSGFDEDAFMAMLRQYQGRPGCLFVVAPDVVADARRTLDQWPWWAALIRSMGYPACFVLQDGQEKEPLPDADAYFLGGTDALKESYVGSELCRRATATGKLLHVGRVNTRDRTLWSAAVGASTIDGTGVSKWPDTNIPKLLRWMREAVNRERETLLWPPP